MLDGVAIWMTMFQHTAARRRLAKSSAARFAFAVVSTHSRPKAAGPQTAPQAASKRGFNTQPPEGGWADRLYQRAMGYVSTHSRPKAAGYTAA